MRQNSIKKNLQEKVNEMSVEELSDYLIEVREKMKEYKLVEDAIKSRLKSDLLESGQDRIVLGNGIAAKLQSRCYYYVPVEKAMTIVDEDMFSLIAKVDLKKAKSVLDKETFKELEGMKEVDKRINSLVFTDA